MNCGWASGYKPQPASPELLCLHAFKRKSWKNKKHHADASFLSGDRLQQQPQQLHRLAPPLTLVQGARSTLKNGNSKNSEEPTVSVSTVETSIHASISASAPVKY